MEIGVEVSHLGTWTVVSVHGEVDVATAPHLRATLIDLVNQGESSMIVDLTAVDFLDSTGLGVLIGALRRVRTVDGDLRLVCTSRRILRVFELTGLGRVFDVHSSLSSAAA